MYLPSSIFGIWLRGVVSIALIAAAAWLFSLWYRDVPERQQAKSPVQETDSSGTIERPHVVNNERSWRIGPDRATAYLVAAMTLSLLSIGGGLGIYPLFFRPGSDEPSSARSEHTTRLRRPDGTELHIEEFGKSDGPVILLTHGWGVDSTEWYYVTKQLTNDYRVVVWDLPGMGHSTRAANNDYAVTRLAHDLQAVVEWTKASQIILVGHSIGGMTLQSYARLYPLESCVKGIALVHTTYTNPLRTTKYGSFYLAIQRPVIVPLLCLTIGLSPLVWLMNLLSYLNGSAIARRISNRFQGRSRGQLNFVASYVPLQSPAVLARGMLAMLRFDESQNLSRIPFPTTVVAAERDPVTLPEASEYLAKNIPSATQVMIPRGRHQAHFELNDDFLGALRQFIHTSLGGFQSRLA